MKKSLEESNDNYELPPIARFCLTIGAVHLYRIGNQLFVNHEVDIFN
ncbi:hypothetical protein ABEY30_15895 [Bacillus pacificus]